MYFPVCIPKEKNIYTCIAGVITVLKDVYMNSSLRGPCISYSIIHVL